MRRTVGVAGLLLWGALAAAPSFAQFSTPYDPDFAPSDQSAPAAPKPASPPPVPEPAPTAVVLPPPTGGAKPVFHLIDREDPAHILPAVESTAPARGTPPPSTEMTLERFQKVRDEVDRGEEPGAEPQTVLGAGWTPPGLDLSISTAAPKPPPPEVELPTYGTSLSVTGRKVIGVNYTEKRYTRDQVTSGRAKTTNLIEINQQLQLRMQGKVGPKITVNVDYDDTKTNQQDISVVYQGDPSEVVQNVSFGDIDLTLPSTEFVSYNKQLFGIRADVKYKGFKATIIGSRTKGTTKSKQFLGNSQFVTTDFLDTSYLRRQYYDLTFGVGARLPIRTGSERVFLARQDPTLTNNVNQQTLTVDDVVRNGVTSSSFTGSFLTLVAGQDYTINYAKGYIQFRNQLQPQYVVAVNYIDAAGNELRFQTSTTTVAGGGSGLFKLIKTPSDVPIISSTTEAGYNREMKTFYSIGQTSIIRDNGRGNFILKILDPNTRQEVGSALNPPQKYPDTITVDFENGIFQLLNPFSASTATPNVPDPNVYAQTPITLRTIHVEYNYRFKTFNLEPNLVVQSELVILDGQKLNRNVDYFIDYEAGFVTFFNPDRILATSEIDITYEVAPFVGATNDTLLGGRVSHDFNQHFAVGSTLLYQAGAKAQTVPQITEIAKSLLVYEFDSQVKKIKIGKKLTVTLQGEFAQSRQNPNLNDFALIDNMEGIKQEDSTSLLASAWGIASNPGGVASDPSKITFTSQDVNVLAINPKAQANNSDTQKVLDVSYDFSNAASQEMSVVYPFSVSGVDMSQRTLLEVVMLGDASNNKINFHLGGINEDADGTGGTTLHCADGRVLFGAPKTEDTDCTGVLSPAKDIGWTYAYGGNPVAGRYGAGNGILDTEDLNRNGRLDPADFTGDDFGSVLAGPTNNPYLYDATSVSTRTSIDFNANQWHTFQIPLNISSITAGNWTNIKQIRITISHAGGGAVTGDLKFARVAVVGNSWQRGQGGDPATAAQPAAQETLTVTPVNNVDNVYTPIYNAGGDASAVFNDLYGSVSNLQKLNNTHNISEQALELSYNGLAPGTTVYTRRTFSTAVDISQHRFFNFLLFGNADTAPPDLSGNTTFFLRVGSDQNYFEVRVPIKFQGWRKISVHQTDPGNGVMNNWAANIPNTVIVSSGSPSLQQVSEIVAGVYGGQGNTKTQGAVYLNEIYVSQPVTRVGSAHKVQADFEYQGWGSFGFKQKAIDRNFQTPTSVVSNQDRQDDNAYLNLTRLGWMPVTMNVSRTITDTPNTIQTGDLSNLVNLLQAGKVTTWNGAAQANLAYGAFPRLNAGYTRNRIEYDLLTRIDDKQNYTGTLQYGVPIQHWWLPRTLDANVGRSLYDVRFQSDFARAQPGDYDTSERGLTYGGRLTFTPWTGSSFNPTYTRTKTTEKRTDYSSGSPVDSAYPKALNQSMGFSSNFRLRPWLNPQINYQMDTIENNVLTVSSIVVNTSTFSFLPGQIKTVNRSANGSISLPIAVADLLPRSRLLHSVNIVSGYQLQDGDVWNNVEKDLDSSKTFFVRQTLRPNNPAAQRANLTLRDTYNSTQRWSPLEAYNLGGRWSALRTLSISNNYVLSIQRTEVTGTASKTITRTLPDAVASISQLEKLWFTERWMTNTQMDFRYSRRTTKNVGTTLNTENTFGTSLRALVLKRFDTSLAYNLRKTDNRDLLVDANTQNTNHEDASGQVTFDVRKFRFTPKVDYSRDVTTLGTGVQNANITVITPSVLMRADLSLPAGLRLPGSSRPLLFTNRIIWTTTTSLALRKSPVTVADNSRLASLNTSADYELAKNLRMTLNGSVQRLWHLYLPEESFLSYAFGTTMTFQF
ncbi:MAG: hypothetical protein KGJ84_05625 [Elusimicrobia bacterium]|nr:hypothetical protein [Elusimicrobiota bacterium]